MRHDEVGYSRGPGFEGERRDRCKSGCSGVSLADRRLVYLAIAVMIIVSFMPIPKPDGEDTPMKLARGGLEAPTLALAFAPDGRSLATAHADGRVALRDAASGWSIRRFLNDRDYAWAVAYSPDGNSLAWCGVETGVVLCDLNSDGADRRLEIPIRYPKAVAFSPDGQALAVSGFSRPEVILWDLHAGRVLKTLRGHGSPVISLAFSPDGRALATGGAETRRSSSGRLRPAGRDGDWAGHRGPFARSPTRPTGTGWPHSMPMKNRFSCGTRRTVYRSCWSRTSPHRPIPWHFRRMAASWRPPTETGPPGSGASSPADESAGSLLRRRC